jgi:hypothetical protein
MLPLKLSITGLYFLSEKKQTIDFDRLMLVYSEFLVLGSGKEHSILEAIGFVLYVDESV